MRDSVESLGENVVYIQKWPWGGSGEYQWWKYYKRPKVTFKEFKQIKERCANANTVAFSFGGSRTVKNGNNVLENVEVSGISYEYPQILSFNIADGRFFTHSEMSSGKKLKHFSASNSSIISKSVIFNWSDGLKNFYSRKYYQ